MSQDYRQRVGVLREAIEEALFQATLIEAPYIHQVTEPLQKALEEDTENGVEETGQERTAGQLVGEAWTKTQVLRDEIDRLNNKCANLESHNEKLHELANTLSKEQEYAKRKAIEYNKLSVDQAEEIKRLTSENESLRQTLARYFGDAKTVQEYEQAEDALRAEVDAQTAEIERLKMRDELLSILHAAIGREFGKKGGLANMEDGIHGLREEIERLRAEVQQAQEKAFKIIRVAEFNADGEIEELANILRDQLRSALKGAE